MCMLVTSEVNFSSICRCKMVPMHFECEGLTATQCWQLIRIWCAIKQIRPRDISLSIFGNKGIYNTIRPLTKKIAQEKRRTEHQRHKFSEGASAFFFKDQPFLDIKACKTNLDICMHGDLEGTSESKAGSLIDFGIDHFWTHTAKAVDLKWVKGTNSEGCRLSPSICINDTASSSCEAAWFQVILSGRQGRQGKEKDEKEDEKPQIQSGTVRGTEGK